MFASRYFPDRYFAPRYWPDVGAETVAVVVARPAHLPVNTNFYNYRHMVERADPGRMTEPTVVYEFGLGRRFVE